jgi:hypothetical protein
LVMEDRSIPGCVKVDGLSDDNVVDFSVIKAAFCDLIDQKQGAIAAFDAQAQAAAACTAIDWAGLALGAPAPAPRPSAASVALHASKQPSEPSADSDAREEVSNQFVCFEREFLLDIQEALQYLDIDIGDLEQLASFDIQRLAAKFGRNFDLVKE